MFWPPCEKYVDAPGQVQTLWRTLPLLEKLWESSALHLNLHHHNSVKY
jgi:hypothetical protein